MSASSIAGLKELLEGLNLSDKLQQATAWCADAGADSVADLDGYEEELAAALALPRIKKDKLVKALRAGGATTPHSAAAAQQAGQQATPPAAMPTAPPQPTPPQPPPPPPPTPPPVAQPVGPPRPSDAAVRPEKKGGFLQEAAGFIGWLFGGGSPAPAPAPAPAPTPTPTPAPPRPSDAAARQLLGKVGMGSLEEAVGARELAWGAKQLDDADAKVVAYVVAASSSMATLNLGGNSIGDEGAKAIAEAVSVSGSLVNLALGSNIGDEGAKALAEAIRSSGSLVTLGLNRCGIGDEGAKALAEAVRSSGSMASLWLNDNSNIGAAGKQSLRDDVRGRQGFNLRL